MEKTQVYLRQEELDALREAAARSGCSVAELIRDAATRSSFRRQRGMDSPRIVARSLARAGAWAMGPAAGRRRQALYLRPRRHRDIHISRSQRQPRRGAVMEGS